MEAEFVKMQAEYYENGRFQSHNLTSWLRISKMFPEMVENVNIDWVTHLELDWEYVIAMLEKIREILWSTL
jgi:hypothetical protein